MKRAISGPWIGIIGGVVFVAIVIVFGVFIFTKMAGFFQDMAAVRAFDAFTKKLSDTCSYQRANALHLNFKQPGGSGKRDAYFVVFVSSRCVTKLLESLDNPSYLQSEYEPCLHGGCVLLVKYSYKPAIITPLGKGYWIIPNDIVSCETDNIEDFDDLCFRWLGREIASKCFGCKSCNIDILNEAVGNINIKILKKVSLKDIGCTYEGPVSVEPFYFYFGDRYVLSMSLSNVSTAILSYRAENGIPGVYIDGSFKEIKVSESDIDKFGSESLFRCEEEK